MEYAKNNNLNRSTLADWGIGAPAASAPSPTPPVAAAPTATPGVIDSGQASGAVSDAGSYIDSLAKSNQALQDSYKKILDSQLAGIESSYASIAENSKKTLAEQSKTSDVVAFRLGQKGTQYDVSRKQKEVDANNKYFQALESEKISKQNDLVTAYKTKNYEAVMQLQKDVKEAEDKQKDFLQKERQNQVTNALALMQENRASKTAQTKEEADTLASLTSQIYNNLTGDPTTDQTTIQDFATQYGLDPNKVMASVLSYRTDQQKVDLLNSENAASILSKTKAGGKLNIPGLGDVEIVGSADKAPETLKAGGKVFSYVGGKWADTGIKDDQFTFENQLNAMLSIASLIKGSDGTNEQLNSIIKNLGSSLGVDIQTPGFKSGNGARTDRHNNPIAVAVSTGGKNEFTDALDKSGIKWSYGDKFPDNPDMQTIKIEGDPVEASRVILSDTGAIQNWYLNHTGKDILAEYGVSNNEDFKALDPDSQKDIINGIYKNEGGSGRLTGNEVKSDTQLNAEMLVDGSMSPTLLGGMGAGRAKAIAAARRLDPKYDPNKEVQRYNAELTYAKNMNSAQMLRYQGLASSVVNTMDDVFKLAEKMKLGGIPVKNKLEMEAYMQANGNSEKGQLVAQYLAAVNTIKEEFANLANGGYAPTDAAWELANKQINANYGYEQLTASLKEIQRLINYRTNAISSVSVNYGQNANTMKVKDLKTGQTGTIPTNEFDANLYEKI